MDALTTYDFYTKEYFGDSIDKSSFDKWLSRAAEKMNYLTYGNITEEALELYSLQIQKATCALIDVMYQIEKETVRVNSNDETNVKSKSSGGESITFGSKETLVTKVLSDKKAQAKLMQDTISEYLSGTGLLYAGG